MLLPLEARRATKSLSEPPVMRYAPATRARQRPGLEGFVMPPLATTRPAPLGAFPMRHPRPAAAFVTPPQRLAASLRSPSRSPGPIWAPAPAPAPVPMPMPTPAPLRLCRHYKLATAPLEPPSRRLAAHAYSRAATPCAGLELLDRTLEALMPLAQLLPSWEAGNALLAEPRRRQVDALVARLRPEVERLTAGVVAHEPTAVATYDRLVAEAVEALRHTPLPGGNALCELWDRLVYQPGDELSDSGTCPMVERAHVLHTLDRLNDHTQSYRRWTRLLAPMIARAHQHRPQPHILDLAAGAGGFAVALKRTLGDAVRVTATDVVPEYLELGRQRAHEEQLQVQFAIQDATQLTPLAHGEVDVFTATQCLHHFPPGMAARMLGEGLRFATVGVCFIDGERGAVPAALMSAFMALYGRRWPVVHDTLVSFRRMYVAEEMRLLAELAPQGAHHAQVHSGRLQPGHAYVVLQRATN